MNVKVILYNQVRQKPSFPFSLLVRLQFLRLRVKVLLQLREQIDLEPLHDWGAALLCFRWCCWRAARATAAAPLALTRSSPSARCSNSPSRAPAPAAVHTRPSWRRCGCTAAVGDVSQRPTDTSSPAAVKSAAKQRPATSAPALSTAKSNNASYSRSLYEWFHSGRPHALWRLSPPRASPVTGNDQAQTGLGCSWQELMVVQDCSKKRLRSE